MLAAIHAFRAIVINNHRDDRRLCLGEQGNGMRRTGP